MSSAFSVVLFLTVICVSSNCFENSTHATSSFRSKRQDPERIKNGKKAAVAALKAISSEDCDWKTNPISLLRGDPCGRYYKVLGLTRHGADLSMIKKRYREKSKILHPDKNPSEEAQKAFTSLTEGYSCLIDDTCRSEYDNILQRMEAINTMNRVKKIQHLSLRLQEFMTKAHYYITYYAAAVDRGIHISV